ncbi:Dps family protein [Roseospirillum parvum]|uniref:Starvation-inducible DNA-binding protein n=1 Tax=Roseospirillum parvum TaxID=83401 RepID=A0A1G7YL47_9PROT|nr:DNA starvation/stationary phase protection protein [Roseospirillum parvum]SDG96969.1 starvation-inducible DNA-binding protein [Roseospirillum parvum]
MSDATNVAIDTGLEQNARSSIAQALGPVLAGTFALALKTHNFHWNVTGPRFQGLHNMFEEQYTDLYEAVDDLAERIRALDAVAPGGLGRFQELSPVADAPETVPDAQTMVATLARDHDAMARTLRPLIGEAAEANDEVTADLLTGRLGVHEKTAWMLRATAA